MFALMNHEFSVGQYVSFESLQTNSIHSVSCPVEILKIPPMECKHVADKSCIDDTGTPFLRAPYEHISGQAPNRPREIVCTNHSRFINSKMHKYVKHICRRMDGWMNECMNERTNERIAYIDKYIQRDRQIRKSIGSGIFTKTTVTVRLTL